MGMEKAPVLCGASLSSFFPSFKRGCAKFSIGFAIGLLYFLRTKKNSSKPDADEPLTKNFLPRKWDSHESEEHS